MDLFTPVTIGPLKLPNRIVMAPMTRNRARDDQTPTEAMATYYAQRASGGLIVTEASQVSHLGVGYPRTPGIHNEAQIEGWRRVTDMVHGAGGRIFLQLWHAGRASHPSLLPDSALPVAPSAIAARGKAFTLQGLLPFPTPRALETREIAGLVAEFGAATQRAQLAGFDGVEIHAGNGYLIDQFLRDGTNRRTDRYGGDAAGRARFLLEIAEAVIGSWSADRVGVRLSPVQSFNDMSDSDPAATFGHVAAALDPLGLAYLHVVEPVTGSEAGQFPPVAPGLRRAFKGPLILNGGYTHALAQKAIAAGEADLISFGAAFLANPDLPERLRRRTPLNPADRATFYGGDERGYTDYPPLPDTVAVEEGEGPSLS
jgi:N-ethylmaleimide reductase